MSERTNSPAAPEGYAGDDSADWSVDGSVADGDAWDQASPELRNIHDTLLTALASIEDPRLSGVRR